MSDQGATAFPSQTMVECGICGEKFDVNWFCKNCAGSICDKCYHIHRKTEISRRHIVVSRTVEVLRLHGPAKIVEICQYHPTKEVSAYCNECKVPCCLLCLSNNHQRHVFSPIEDMYLSAEKNLDKYVRELQKDVKPTLDEMMKSFKEHIERNEVQIEKVKAEINIFKQTLIQRVVESCDLLLKEIDQVKDDGRHFVNELRASKDKRDHLMKDIVTIIGVGKLDIIEYSPPDQKSFIKNPPLHNLTLPRFVPRNYFIDLIEKKIEIGKIEFDKEITKMQKKSSTRPKDILNEKISSSPVSCIDKPDISVLKVRSFKSKTVLTSLTTAGNNSSWVMSELGNTMYLYRNNGQLIRSAEVKISHGINDMVISRSGDMILACHDNKVRRLSVGGRVVTLINTKPYRPEGMCLTDSDEVVVCLRGREVAVYSPDGRSKLREIRGEDSQGTPQISDPYRVVCNGKDLCVVDGDSNVVCVDDSDNVRWIYDDKQVKLMKKFYPLGICVDKYHHLLVTDYNKHCVHYLNREGELIQVILTQEQTGLRWPWGISVDDETGQVWVGNNSGDVNVVIAKYLK